jgi:hypothetical protein
MPPPHAHLTGTDTSSTSCIRNLNLCRCWLSVRRANHIVELETSITSLRSEHASLQSAFSASQKRESHLKSRIRDLGSALFSDGLSGEVNGTRRAWPVFSSSSSPTGPLGGEGGGKRLRTISGRDPLHTLAQTALAPEHAREGAPLPPLVSQWNRPSSHHSESDEKKCKREALDAPLYPPTFEESSSASEAGSHHDQAFESLHGCAHERVASRGYNRTREHTPRRIPVEPTTAGASSAGISEPLVNPSLRSPRVASVPLPLAPSSSSNSLFTPPEWAAPLPGFIRIEDLLSPMAPVAASLRSQAHTPKVGQELLHNPALLHFSGHGTPEGEFCFEDELRKTAKVNAKAFAKLLALAHKKGLKGAVLNAGYSENDAQLLADATGYAVAMKGQLSYGDAQYLHARVLRSAGSLRGCRWMQQASLGHLIS